MSPLVRHIIVPNVDQTASFTCQCMLNRHPLTTPITVVGHVLGHKVVPQADVVPPFLRRQAGPVQTIRYYREPGPCGTALQFPPLNSGRILPPLVQVPLLPPQVSSGVEMVAQIKYHRVINEGGGEVPPCFTPWVSSSL